MPTIFISAANPMWKPTPQRANDARNYQLYMDLHRYVREDDIRATKFVDKTHPYNEDGFRVSNLSVKDAVFLAKYYGQHTIIVDGKGLLNVNTMMFNRQTAKHVGPAATKRSAYSAIEGMQPVSYEFADKEVRYRP